MWRSMATSVRDLAAQFLALAEKQRATGPLMMAHAIMGHASLNEGDFSKAVSIMIKRIALYDPAEHRPLGDAFWSRHSGDYLVLSLAGPVVPWLSRGRAQRTLNMRVKYAPRDWAKLLP